RNAVSPRIVHEGRRAPDCPGTVGAEPYSDAPAADGRLRAARAGAGPGRPPGSTKTTVWYTANFSTKSMPYVARYAAATTAVRAREPAGARPAAAPVAAAAAARLTTETRA